MPGLGGPYETKENILSFLQKLKSDLTLTDIDDAIYKSGYEIINNRTDTHWDMLSGTILRDGTGRDYVFTNIVPIVSISEIKIINIDTSEDSLDVAGTDRQVWWDTETGCIERIQVTNNDITRDPDWGPLFPVGQQNIKITGVFGRDADNHDSQNILKMLHILNVMKMMSFKYPAAFKTVDAIEEKIGEYSYRIGDMQYTNNNKNQKLTLEGYIDYLYGCLPKDDQICLEDI